MNGKITGVTVDMIDAISLEIDRLEHQKDSLCRLYYGADYQETHRLAKEYRLVGSLAWLDAERGVLHLLSVWFHRFGGQYKAGHSSYREPTGHRWHQCSTAYGDGWDVLMRMKCYLDAAKHPYEFAACVEEMN